MTVKINLSNAHRSNIATGIFSVDMFVFITHFCM